MAFTDKSNTEVVLPDFSYSAAGNSDASVVLLAQPISTTKITAKLGARAEMRVLFFEIRGCNAEREFFF